jgi:hypothetical protein
VEVRNDMPKFDVFFLSDDGTNRVQTDTPVTIEAESVAVNSNGDLILGSYSIAGTFFGVAAVANGRWSSVRVHV